MYKLDPVAHERWSHRPIRTDGTRLSASRWTLLELLGMVGVAAFSSFFAAAGSPYLGLCVLVVAIGTRVALVDFTVVGDIATGLVVLFGIPLIFLMIFWASAKALA